VVSPSSHRSIYKEIYQEARQRYLKMEQNSID